MNRLRVYLNSFDSNAQAALVLHEAIYKYRREARLDTDSVITRRMVGLIFSNQSAEELKKQLGALGEKEFGDLGMMGVSPGSYGNQSIVFLKT